MKSKTVAHCGLICDLCDLLKNINKRYRKKYGESAIDNVLKIKHSGIRVFIDEEKEKWKCTGY